MRKQINLIIILMTMVLMSCTESIDIEIESGEEQYVIDAVITDQEKEQIIKISKSTQYFNSEGIKNVSGAEVIIKDFQDKTYHFQEREEGEYVLQEILGELIIGEEYILEINIDGNKFSASSTPNRAPKIDSISWKREKEFMADADSIWKAQFWARDLEGAGNIYWIRPSINGAIPNGNENFGSIAYDGSSIRGTKTDNIIFIPPLRETITPNFRDDKYLEPGDEVGVQLYGISNAFAEYLAVLESQINNSGLFATPSTNLPTNIISEDPTTNKALGWFEVCMVSEDYGIISYSKSSNQE